MTTRIFIDCEWNDYKGALISMALVTETHNNFYMELPYEQTSEWVTANVIPHLTGHPAPAKMCHEGLLRYFDGIDDDILIIADWPEDIAHFCNFLITGPGKCLPVQIDRIKFELHPCHGNHKSKVPHHALYDAIANMKNYLGADDAPLSGLQYPDT
jgi:hypothetical protein